MPKLLAVFAILWIGPGLILVAAAITRALRPRRRRSAEGAGEATTLPPTPTPTPIPTPTPTPTPIPTPTPTASESRPTCSCCGRAYVVWDDSGPVPACTCPVLPKCRYCGLCSSCCMTYHRDDGTCPEGPEDWIYHAV
ncbi:MAG: hypothetical protein IRY99_03425 [Isosphaeraceae bacterium]|nr:hypothetical protein [Isosphaeraceae bacterium]